MQCYKYRGRQGAIHVLTKHQEHALKVAKVWRTLHLTPLETLEGAQPTKTDAQIVREYLRDCTVITHVGLIYPQFRDPSKPWFVRSPRLTVGDAVVDSIHGAIRVARGLYKCEIITLSRGDCERPPYDFADEIYVALLAI